MDSYSPCPCGSGKKLKFCCQGILSEMSKIERLQENNQPRMALQLIDKVLKDHPENAWLVTQRAMALFNDERHEEARDGLVKFLRVSPDHPLANALLAIAVSQLEPIEKCKKVIHRAFIKSISGEPQLVALLAGRLVTHFLDAGHDMAARQHMAIVLRLGNEEERQRTLMAMLELDADTNVPYPLRGPHPLPSYEPSEELAAGFRKAKRLYVNGCFAEAADVLLKLSEQGGTSPQLWHTIGLMRAWDGDESQAADALHRAARLYDDFDQAVDLETVAQLLDRRQKENSVVSRFREYKIKSLSRLLTRLDNEDRLSRVPLLDRQQSGIAAAYDVLDRVAPVDSELADMDLDSAPRSIGRISLFDQEGPDDPATANLIGIEGERLENIVALFEATAGELAERDRSGEKNDEGEEDDIVAWYAKDELVLSESAYFPPKTPANVRQKLRQEFIRRCIDDTWFNSPQSALDGKSPEQSKGEESLRVPLAASVRVFDAFLDRKNIILDQQQLRSRLDLPEPAPIRPSDDVDLNALTVPQLQQLQTDGMSDELFNKVLQRALVIKHCGLGYRLLVEFVQHRPELVEKDPQEAEQAHSTLAEICSHSLRDDEALDWIDRGFEYAKSRGGEFQSLLMWKMRELSYRIRNVDDPRLNELLLELWNYYGAKLPMVRERVQEVVQVLDIEPPWETAIVTPSVSAGGTVWTAETEQTVEGEKKLWLPES